MARENFILKTLLEKGEVIWRPKGNSMTPRIHSGEQVKVINCLPEVFRVGDVAYAKVRGNYYLHLLTAIDSRAGTGYLARFQISNNHGHVNGWTDAKNMFGILVQVEDKILLTQEDLTKRLAQVDGNIQFSPMSSSAK
jgi:hypothetical protein